MRRVDVLALVAAGSIATVAFAAWPDKGAAGCRTYTPASVPLVAHAGGGLPDRIYTNDLEALNLAARHGFRYVELDFVEQNGRLRLGHDTEHLSNLSLDDLVRWLDRHPSISVITDIKTDNLSGLSTIPPSVRGRFIPQIYQPSQLKPVASLNYARIIFAERIGESRDWFPWVNEARLWAVTIPKEKAALAQKIRHPVFLYTVNEPRSDAGLYTDCLIPAVS